MPSQVRIISKRNSAQWDKLVDALKAQLRKEHVYGGCASEERADEVRKKIRTAAKRQGLAAKVFWQPCDKPGACEFGRDCSHHVKMTFYPLEAGRAYKARQAREQQQR